MPKEYTPKATLTLRNVGPGMDIGKSTAASFVSTYRLRRGKINASVAFSDKTFTPLAFDDIKKFKDVVSTCDVKLGTKVTANTKYELGTKKYQVGATWDGKLAGKVTQVKGWYTNKDNLASGEATVALNPKAKANVTFNQQKLLSSKLTLTKGTFVLEPSYNFPKNAASKWMVSAFATLPAPGGAVVVPSLSVRQVGGSGWLLSSIVTATKGPYVAEVVCSSAQAAPAVSVTKKVGKKSDTVKLSYDVKSEGTTLEYAHKPFKLSMATTVGRSLKFARPIVTAMFENTYQF